jgi:hypothetical protein
VNRTRWLVVLLAIGASALIGMMVAGGPSGLSREKVPEWTPPAVTSTPVSTPIPTDVSNIIIPTIIVPTPEATPGVVPTNPAATPVTAMLSATPRAEGTLTPATPEAATPLASPESATPVSTPRVSTPESTISPTDGTSVD